jgi:hypothetical protein
MNSGCHIKDVNIAITSEHMVIFQLNYLLVNNSDGVWWIDIIIDYQPLFFLKERGGCMWKTS